MSFIECANCGVSFGLTESCERNRREDHRNFYCPNGHSQAFPSESDAERYKRLMESAQAAANRYREKVLAAERAREKAEKSLKTLKKRTAAGVCPCCSRTVSQLARHMNTKHKEFLALNGLLHQKALTGEIEKPQ